MVSKLASLLGTPATQALHSKRFIFDCDEGATIAALLSTQLKFVAYLLADIRSLDLNQRRFLFLFHFSGLLVELLRSSMRRKPIRCCESSSKIVFCCFHLQKNRVGWLRPRFLRISAFSFFYIRFLSSLQGTAAGRQLVPAYFPQRPFEPQKGSAKR